MNALSQTALPYFESLERRQALVTEAQSWLGTPFRPHAGVKGVGADCVGLVHGILHNIGAIGEVTFPDYTMDGGSHLTASQLGEFIISLGWFTEVKFGVVETGDLVTFKLGRVAHHVGLAVSQAAFIHVYRGMCAGEATLADPTWKTRLTAVYRLLDQSSRITDHASRITSHP